MSRVYLVEETTSLDSTERVSGTATFGVAWWGNIEVFWSYAFCCGQWSSRDFKERHVNLITGRGSCESADFMKSLLSHGCLSIEEMLALRIREDLGRLVMRCGLDNVE